MKRFVPIVLLVACGCSETGVSVADDDDAAPIDDDDAVLDDDDAVPDDDDDDAAPTCTDRLEPNDDADGASTLDPDNYSGLWACPDEDDWFRLDLRVFDTFLFDAFADGQHGDIDLFIYDDEGTLLASSAEKEGDEHLVFVAPDTGVYYAVVTLTTDHGDEGAEYLLNLQIDPAYCVQDPWEPNPTFTQAPFIFPHPWWNQVVCPDDEDWYETAQWAGPLLQIWAFFDPAEGDINLSLHDGTTGELLVESTGTGGEEYVEWLTVDGPPYSFRVWHEQDGGRYFGNVYDLLIEQTYPDGCARDAFEFNDGQGWAWPIGTGSYPGLQACASDADWFKIVGTAGDELVVEVPWDDAEGGLDVGLHDSTGAPLGTVTAGAASTLVEYTMPTNGDVFLEVLLGNDVGSVSGTSYSLEVTGQSPVCYPDTWEPNNHLGQAAGLGLDPYVGLSLCSDDDWFNRLVVQDDTFTVTVNHDPADGELALRLYDGGGGMLTFSASGTGSETVSYTPEITQFVYVEIEFVADGGALPGFLYDLTASTSP